MPGAQRALTRREKVTMQKRMNVEEVLAGLARIRAALPARRERRAREEKTSRMDVGSVEEFELGAVRDALEELADDVGGIVREKQEALYEQVLDVYYATEELSREPEHAHLVEHVEKMRAAHLRSYGRPVPTKEETERRRAALRDRKSPQ